MEFDKNDEFWCKYNLGIKNFLARKKNDENKLQN